MAVAGNHQRAETERAATLDHLGASVDAYDGGFDAAFLFGGGAARAAAATPLGPSAAETAAAKATATATATAAPLLASRFGMGRRGRGSRRSFRGRRRWRRLLDRLRRCGMPWCFLGLILLFFSHSLRSV